MSKTALRRKKFKSRTTPSSQCAEWRLQQTPSRRWRVLARQPAQTRRRKNAASLRRGILGPQMRAPIQWCFVWCSCFLVSSVAASPPDAPEGVSTYSARWARSFSTYANSSFRRSEHACLAFRALIFRANAHQCFRPVAPALREVVVSGNLACTSNVFIFKSLITAPTLPRRPHVCKCFLSLCPQTPFFWPFQDVGSIPNGRHFGVNFAGKAIQKLDRGTVFSRRPPVP